VLLAGVDVESLIAKDDRKKMRAQQTKPSWRRR
jgi:hypothetical protein